MNQENHPESLNQEEQTRRFELIDFDSFVGSTQTATDASEDTSEAADLTPSGRQIWTWETLDNAGQPAEEAEPAQEADPDAPFTEDAPEEAAEASQDAEAETPVPRKRREKKRKAAKRRNELPPDKAYRYYTKSVNRTVARMQLSFFLAAVAIYLTLAGVYGWWLPQAVLGGLHLILPILVIVQLVLCLEIPIRAIYEVFQGQLRLDGYLLLASLFTALDGFLNPGINHICYGAVPVLGLSLALWGSCQRSVALRRTAKVLTAVKEPWSVITAEDHWNQQNCLYQRQLPLDGFILNMEEPDLVQTTMGWYAPAAIIAALALAGISALKTKGFYVEIFSILLCAGLPAAAAFSFSRPFARLAKRLQYASVALCGWTGAQTLNGTDSVIVTDEDLFPAGSIQHSGVKVYNDYTPAQAISYAAAVLQQEGGTLSELFQELLPQVRGQAYACGDYRAYEGGGLGGEVRNNIILVGSLSFMRLMGVDMPQGTAVRDAAYISINGELAAVVALHYKTSKLTASALESLVSQRHLKTVLATRNFLVTPALLKQLYHLPSDRFLYPSMANRRLLSEAPEDDAAFRSAIAAGQSISAKAKTLLAGRHLFQVTRLSLLINLIGGVIGLLLLFYLTLIGAAYSLNPANLVLYILLWAIPPLLISTWAQEE